MHRPAKPFSLSSLESVAFPQMSVQVLYDVIMAFGTTWECKQTRANTHVSKQMKYNIEVLFFGGLKFGVCF